MKIAVIGKGGVGKTSISAVLARSIGRMGRSVVALDCDTNPNLGLSLGVGDDETQRIIGIRQQVSDKEAEHAHTWDDLIDRFGTDAPDGVRLGIVNRIENPEPGCPCCGLSAERLLSETNFGDSIVISDFEAGLGIFSRVGESKIDVTIVVVEPTPRSLDVGLRALKVARHNKQGKIVIIANKVSSKEEFDFIKETIADDLVTLVPFSDALVDADRRGVSIFDVPDHDSFVKPIERLAAELIN